MTSNKLKLDPITHRRRGAKAYGKQLPSPEVVKAIDQRIAARLKDPAVAGHNTILYKRMEKAPARIARLMKAKGYNPKEITLKQALIVSRIGARYVDHLINRVRDVVTTETHPGQQLTREQEVALWEDSYHKLIRQMFLRNKNVENREVIVATMEKLMHCAEPPHRALLAARARHWAALRALEIHIQDEDPEEWLAGEFQRIMNRLRKSPSKPDEEFFRFRAREICLSVSVYADLMETRHKYNWTTTYAETMLKLYPAIVSNSRLLAAIIHLE
jgi:hypothetical protein